MSIINVCVALFHIFGANHIYIHPITNIFRVSFSFTYIKGIAKFYIRHCSQIHTVIVPAINSFSANTVKLRKWREK